MILNVIVLIIMLFLAAMVVSCVIVALPTLLNAIDESKEILKKWKEGEE